MTNSFGLESHLHDSLKFGQINLIQTSLCLYFEFLKIKAKQTAWCLYFEFDMPFANVAEKRVVVKRNLKYLLL